jgi:protein-S-isoprenylcysteine O-methyltransferase Ste14
MYTKSASVIGFIIALISILELIDQESIIATGVIGIVVQILSIFLMIWARLTFGKRSFHVAANPTEGGLVTNGPYRYLRHPIYAAILYFIWAGILSHLSTLTFSIGLTATFGLFIRVLAEESLVKQRYREYIEYAARTKRIIPFVL